ncbi:Crp/Fnr family transcriptional regulator [Adhaeribacter arboris]|uniref:Crp/Fnr family transcriptional regulator n=1 Tax=Adhaeribacter arboris TaxID=2072846 RepID=UPI0013049046|nr:Crp/Fnr family transcriptional regulator [Adhaeribacter arboris]
MSEESRKIFSATLTFLEIKKGGYLLQADEVCPAIFFIVTGYYRSFYLNDGEEKNTNFYFENSFATNVKSLTQNTKSDYFIQAEEQSSVIRLDKTKLLEAYKQSHEIERLGRKLLELILMNQEEHANLFKLFTPQQRYVYLQRTQPELFNRVSLTQIASYIGISRETLSRIRGRK